jgi:hypothetical protein
MLRSKVKGSAVQVSSARFANDRTIKEIAAIEVYAGLRGVKIEDSAGAWLVNVRGQAKRAIPRVEYKGVIVTAGES